MQDARCEMRDAVKGYATPSVGTPAQPQSTIAFPQITQIDADSITKGPVLYLRDLRDLRANWMGGSSNQDLASGIGWMGGPYGRRAE